MLLLRLLPLLLLLDAAMRLLLPLMLLRELPLVENRPVELLPLLLLPPAPGGGAAGASRTPAAVRVSIMRSWPW